MLIPGRHEASGSYRYGFQGQEKDDEIKGEGNSLNYTFRMHDPRVGRFFAVDPLTAKYPWYTPYSFSGNKVIAFVELEGLEEAPINQGTEEGQPDTTEYTTYTGGVHGGVAKKEAKWVWHSGGLKGSSAGWMTEESYNSMMGLLFDIISSPNPDLNLNGSWEDEDGTYSETSLKSFLNDPNRKFITGYREELLNLLDVSVANREAKRAYLRSGHIKTDDFNSPVFLFSGILKKISLGKVAKAAENVIVDAAKGGFSKFSNLDDLVGMFEGKNLGNAADDLLNSGWTKVEGDWGTKTIFQKQIGKDRFYAIWESANLEHSINNLPTSYWKLTKGKISAYGDNVRRVSDAANFKQ